MKIFKKIFASFFLLSIIISCNKKLFVDKEYVITKTKGIAVFIDNESRKYRTFGTGDVRTSKDSLIPDFFIPYNFSKKTITREDMDKALFSKSAHKVSFFYLIRDCKEEERSSSIDRETIALLLDKNIDDYLHSNKIFVQPVELEYLKYSNSLVIDYYDLHKSLTIFYKSKPIRFLFNRDYFDVLRMNVLEYDWEK